MHRTISGKPARRSIAVAVLAVLTILWTADAVVTANRMQGDRIGLWFRQLSQSPLQLSDYGAVRKLLHYEHLSSPVTSREGTYTVTIQGSQQIALDDTLDRFLASRSIHPSAALGIYGMRFGRGMLEEFERTGSQHVLSSLARAIGIVLDSVERWTLPPEVIAFNDHAVAERTEFLLLFLSKLQELDRMPELQERLRRHITHNAALLADDSRFTWQTNHGLMQIRSLLHLAAAAPNSSVGRRSRDAAVSRIGEILPFLIADDGAVLEAASEYWLVIQKEWAYIAAIPGLPPEVRSAIASRLEKVADFLRTVVNCEGFLQGLGDAYSRTLDGDYVARDKSVVFSFSNGLAGLEYPSGRSCTQVLLVSLDTPPAVHKMPEDLAVYVFAGEPLFINAGTYAYDDSPQRRYVLEPESQSTVMWASPGSFLSSRISAPRWADGQLVFAGEKSATAGRITREVVFFPATGRLRVTDRSDREMISLFNIHPDVRPEEISSGELVLRGKKSNVRVRHDGRRSWNDRWVATGFARQTPIRQLEISGNPITVEMDLPATNSLRPGDGSARAGSQRRTEVARDLSGKYRASALSRHEWPSRFMKLRLLMLITSAGVAGLFLFAPLAWLAWGLFVASAIAFAADISAQGLLATALLALFE